MGFIAMKIFFKTENINGIKKNISNRVKIFNHLNDQPIILTRVDIDRIIVENKDYLYGFIKKRAWNYQEVEDIFQTTALEAIKAYKKFRGKSSPKTWLCGIAINVMRANARCNEMKNIVSIDDVDEADYDCVINQSRHGDPHYTYENNVFFEKIKNIYLGMSDEMQETYSLVINKGLSYQLTADQLHVPVGTVRSRISRAREIMRCAVSH